MPFTKEKALALIALGISLVVAFSLHLPKTETVPEVPPEQSARPYRTLWSPPQLAPAAEGAVSLRNVFRVKDPWGLPALAPLKLPPPILWPRALPGGVSERVRNPQDRRLVWSDPQKITPPPPEDSQ